MLDRGAGCRSSMPVDPCRQEKPCQAANIFHRAENKLGGGRNWAIFQIAGTQSIQTEFSQPVLNMKHPLAIAQHYQTASASLSSSSHLWLIMEASGCTTGGQSNGSYSCKPAPCHHSLAHTRNIWYRNAEWTLTSFNTRYMYFPNHFSCFM